MPPSEEQKAKKAKLLQLYDAGRTLPDIAAELGLSYHAVRQALLRARKATGKPARKKGPAPKPPGEAVTKANRRVVVFLPDDIRRRLKLYAVVHDIGASAVVARALDDFFRRHPIEVTEGRTGKP